MVEAKPKSASEGHELSVIKI